MAGPQLITPPPTLAAKLTGNRVHVMVQLKREPTVKKFQKTIQTQGSGATVQANAAAASHLSAVKLEQATFASALSSAGLQTAKEIYRLQRTYNGVVMTVDKGELDQLRTLPGVKAVHPMALQRLHNARSMPFLGVPEAWDSLGLDGTGITVGIIDTGIDYDHVNFGGSGDYSGNPDPAVIEQGTFPT
ncbi:MAG: hypothetical protein JRI55_39130, partial [Deltaproteobacteria bacterium]|nr:hypothetical protein [Deltaproteobacteria bacterium]